MQQSNNRQTPMQRFSTLKHYYKEPLRVALYRVKVLLWYSAEARFNAVKCYYINALPRYCAKALVCNRTRTYRHRERAYTGSYMRSAQGAL